MAPTDKTRKILWGRSGNRCAICRQELVVARTALDSASVIGEECHITSGKKNGPRFDADFPSDEIDHFHNLILLCRDHHKMVDDQRSTYTVEGLRQLKSGHEQWVAERLDSGSPTTTPGIRRVADQIPEYLFRLSTGSELLMIVDGAKMFAFGNDDPKTADEADLLAGFLGMMQDWGDIGSELDAGGKVRIGFDLNETLHELHNAGFAVFGGREIQILEGGVGPPSDWPVAIIQVARETDPQIQRVSFDWNDELI